MPSLARVAIEYSIMNYYHFKIREIFVEQTNKYLSTTRVVYNNLLIGGGEELSFNGVAIRF